jgi:hypothetical protein
MLLCLGPALAILALGAPAVGAYDERLCNDGSYTSPESGLTCKTPTCGGPGTANGVHS